MLLCMHASPISCARALSPLQSHDDGKRPSAQDMIKGLEEQVRRAVEHQRAEYDKVQFELQQKQLELKELEAQLAELKRSAMRARAARRSCLLTAHVAEKGRCWASWVTIKVEFNVRQSPPCLPARCMQSTQCVARNGACRRACVTCVPPQDLRELEQRIATRMEEITDLEGKARVYEHVRQRTLVGVCLRVAAPRGHTLTLRAVGRQTEKLEVARRNRELEELIRDERLHCEELMRAEVHAQEAFAAAQVRARMRFRDRVVVAHAHVLRDRRS